MKHIRKRTIQTGRLFFSSSLIFLFCGTIIQAQCPESDIFLETQTEVNNFAVLYPNCTEIAKGLRIGDTNMSTEITDLSPLSDIISIGDYLDIVSNVNLINLSGLNNLASVGGDLSILGNTSLMNLDGLENLTSIGGFLWIGTDDNLSSLSSLENVTSIGGDLRIGGNDNLNSLKGLGNVTSIGGLLWIVNNSNLNNISDIQNIAYHTIADLDMYDNPMLDVCNYPNICDYIENEGESTIFGNAPNCKNVIEIQNTCLVSTTLAQGLASVIISPNPTKSTFAVQGIPAGTYQIHNTSGQLIQEGNLQNDELIDISQEAKGVYFISIMIDNEVFVRRVVKM